MSLSPRGRVVGTNKPVRVTDTVEVVGRFPVLVVGVKATSNRNVKAFHYWMNRLGLEGELVQDLGGLQYWNVWGLGEALERLTTFEFIESFHLPIACRIAWQGSGGGEKKPFRQSDHVRAAIKADDKRNETAASVKQSRKGFTEPADKAIVNETRLGVLGYSDRL